LIKTSKQGQAAGYCWGWDARFKFSSHRSNKDLFGQISARMRVHALRLKIHAGKKPFLRAAALSDDPSAGDEVALKMWRIMHANAVCPAPI
jgi:hypothetical protein